MLRTYGPLLICVALCSVLISACSAPPTDIPAQIVTRKSTVIAATATPIPTPLPSATPFSCPAVRDVPFPARPLDFSLYAGTLQDYLSDGGNPDTLMQVLDSWEAGQSLDNKGVLRGDLTADGTPEIIISYTDPNSEFYPPDGQMAIYTCQDGRVRTLYTYTPGEWMGLSLVGVEDLTADGMPDLAFAEVSCGANTCWYTLHIWSWNGADFTEYIGGDFTLPYATFLIEDGQVLANSAGMGSVGAGPQRPYTETWSWNGSVVTYTTSELGPAVYRYHTFQDGDTALFADDYDDAYWAYLNVLNDDTLESWESFYDDKEEYRWLTALAHWRLVLLGMKLENYPDAESHYQRLQEDFPPNTPGHTVAVIAKRFWERYIEVGNIAYGCQDVVEMFETQQILEFLNSYGYANPIYVEEDICPYLVP